MELLLMLAMLSLTPTDALLDCHTAAAGPRFSGDPPRTLEVRLHIAEPGFQVEGIYRASRDGRMRIDIFAGEKRVFAEALEGERGWQWRPGQGVSTIGEAGAAALRHGIELPGRFFTFADMASRGHRLADLGQSRSGERILEVTLDDGHRKRYWLDPETCLVRRSQDVRAFHPDLDDTEVTVETRASDYRLVDGVRFSFHSEQWNADDAVWLGTTTVTGVTVDPDLSFVRFDLSDLADG